MRSLQLHLPPLIQLWARELKVFVYLRPMERRIIGRHEGMDPGPLLICIGGMHGNEPAGLQAIEEVFRLLHIEHLHNPGFIFRGAIVGLRGNLEAIRQQKRFIHRDLNRMLLQEEIDRIGSLPEENLVVEDKECLELIRQVEMEKMRYNPSLTLILDLHTTTADGGLFTIAGDDPMSRTLAKGLHTPVILGFEEELKGTTLHYFNRPAEHTHCIVFEAGQHQDPGSVHRTAAAIVNCMRAVGAVDSKDVDHRHDGLLILLSEGLPKVTRLVYHYRLRPDETFTMQNGFRNFQPVQRGQILAHNESGPVTAPVDGLILMPKYQPQGDDGFFIVTPVE